MSTEPISTDATNAANTANTSESVSAAAPKPQATPAPTPTLDAKPEPIAPADNDNKNDLSKPGNDNVPKPMEKESENDNKKKEENKEKENKEKENKEKENKEKENKDEKKVAAGVELVTRSKWLGIGLPFRPAAGFGTFSFFDASNDSFPEVNSDEFKHILTAADVMQHEKVLHSLIASPTGCSIINIYAPDPDTLAASLPAGFRRFYADVVNHVSWAYDENSGAVFGYLDATPKSTLICVAQTMPEFWARLKIESEIYWTADIAQDSAATRKLFLVSSGLPTFLTEVSKLDLNQIWSDIVLKHFKPEHVYYLQPFYQKFSKLQPNLTATDSAQPQISAVTNHPPITSASILNRYLLRGHSHQPTSTQIAITSTPTVRPETRTHDDDEKDKKEIVVKKHETREEQETQVMGLPASAVVVMSMIATAVIGAIAPWNRGSFK
jgi:hypothetical protein